MSLAASLALTLAPVMSFTGNASTDDNASYVEAHSYFECPEAQLCESVTYTDADEIIAEKRIEYNQVAWQPDFEFQDYRFDLIEKVKTRGNVIEVSRTSPEKSISFSVEQSDNIVFDAGFHPFVQHQFSALEAGETIRFLFLATTRENPIRFQMRATEMDAQTITINVRINNRILALFVDDISLTYRRNDKTLLAFDGLTNMRRASGDGNWNAQIIYQY